MGSKGGRGRSSSSLKSPATVVCCMCGDYGIRNELFRCKVCLYRSQHKYCSDLYPKAETYRACNWCLREEANKSGTAKESNSSLSSSSNDTSNSGNNNGGGGRGGRGNTGSGSVKLHRTTFSSQLNKPIKKHKAPERSSSDVSEKMRSAAAAAALSPADGRATKHVFRARVRRYKLLEEVSS